MTESDQLKWGSHLPSLLACLGDTSGPVLELGVGDFSTPALHALCVAMNRKLVSVESNPEWMKKFMPTMMRDGHQFIIGDYDVIIPDLAKQEWAVSFIDNSPGGERRAKDFASLLPVSQFVVVHDYHGENKDAISLLRFVPVAFCICERQQPPTLIASIKRPIPNAALVL